MRSDRSEYSPASVHTTDEINMDLFEANTHPFIVKIWLEETAEEAGQATWRGHITHVPTGERRYLKDLDDIVAFIIPYLEGMGVKPTPFQRLRQWINQRRLCLRVRKADQ
jgi:hypothetical protein